MTALCVNSTKAATSTVYIEGAWLFELVAVASPSARNVDQVRAGQVRSSGSQGVCELLQSAPEYEPCSELQLLAGRTNQLKLPEYPACEISQGSISREKIGMMRKILAGPKSGPCVTKNCCN
jgi:hypothetical protein